MNQAFEDAWVLKRDGLVHFNGATSLALLGDVPKAAFDTGQIQPGQNRDNRVD